MAGNKPHISRSLLFLQYLRWLPAQLGLFNKGAFMLQINRISPNDHFIASYPKSVNTWLRFIIANLLTKGEEINFANIDQYVPDVYTSKTIINKQKSNRYIKTHHTFFDYYPKTIYIYRDYRDVLVSFYYYETALKHFSGSFKEFITSKNLTEAFGSWMDHVKLAFEHQKKHPDKILLLKYEELLEQPIKGIEKIAKFCSITPTLSFEAISERCEFSRLKEGEAKTSGDFKKISNQHFFRQGKKGVWPELFSEEIVALLKSNVELTAFMKKLGYTY